MPASQAAGVYSNKRVAQVVRALRRVQVMEYAHLGPIVSPGSDLGSTVVRETAVVGVP